MFQQPALTHSNETFKRDWARKLDIYYVGIEKIKTANILWEVDAEEDGEGLIITILYWP